MMKQVVATLALKDLFFKAAIRFQVREYRREFERKRKVQPNKKKNAQPSSCSQRRTLRASFFLSTNPFKQQRVFFS